MSGTCRACAHYCEAVDERLICLHPHSGLIEDTCPGWTEPMVGEVQFTPINDDDPEDAA